MQKHNELRVTVISDRKAVFSARLKHVMKEQGITQQELADRINISRQLISQYVNGKSLPRTATLLRISEAFNLSETWFLGYKDYAVSNVNDVLSKSEINIILDMNFKDIEALIKDKFSFIDDTFLNLLRQQYLNSLYLNYQGVKKLDCYLSDIKQIKAYQYTCSLD